MLELWFDFSCPYAYLASQQAAGLGVPIDWRPMLLGGVFRGIGAGDGPMATLSPQKARHNLQDMHRWAELFGAPFRMPAAHPMRTVRALRILLGLPRSRWPDAIAAIYAAYWQRGEDVTRDDVITGALRAAGTRADDIASALTRADSDEIKAELRRRTDEAIELGIFGAPAWVLRRTPQALPDRAGAPEGTAEIHAGHVLLWGQDRLDFVRAVLAGWEPDASPPPDGPRSIATTLEAELAAAGTARPPSTLDVYFDVASPFAYLALTQLPALAEATGVTPRLEPILLGALFRDIGQANVPWFEMPAPKRRHVGLEMARWARWWGVPFESPRKFPQRTVTAQRLCLLATEHDAEAGLRLALALGRAMWAEQRDLEDAAVLRELLAREGLPEHWVDRTQDAEVKARLVASTQRARDAGAFGVPTFVVNGRHLFWGQDRLALVARALAGWAPVHG